MTEDIVMGWIKNGYVVDVRELNNGDWACVVASKPITVLSSRGMYTCDGSTFATFRKTPLDAVLSMAGTLRHGDDESWW